MKFFKFLPIVIFLFSSLDLHAQTPSQYNGVDSATSASTYAAISGTTFTGHVKATPDYVSNWMTNIGGFSGLNAAVSGLSSGNYSGVAGACQTLTISANPSDSCWGLGALGVSNNTTNILGAWGIYVEGRSYAGAGNILTAELNTTNFNTNVAINPYLYGASTQLAATLWLSAGRGDAAASPASQTNVSVAIGIGNNNPSTFTNGVYRAGIVFDKLALLGDNGSTGFAPAIIMAKGHYLLWKGPDNNNAQIRSDCSSYTNCESMVFVNAGVQWNNSADGSVGFRVEGTSGATNYVDVIPSNGGSAQITSTSGPLLLHAGASSGIFLTTNLSVGQTGNLATTGTILGASLRSTATTFALGGACNSGNEGTLQAISDSTTVVWGATVTGGGANHIAEYCDGTNWTVAAK